MGEAARRKKLGLEPKINIDRFNTIVKECFPDWDTQGWKAEFATKQELTINFSSGDTQRLQGGCFKATKTIKIFPWWKNPDWEDYRTHKPVPKEYHDDYLDCTLIHETCHAILLTKGRNGLDMSHTTEWFELMNQALKRINPNRKVLIYLLERNMWKWKRANGTAETGWNIDDNGKPYFESIDRSKRSKLPHFKEISPNFNPDDPAFIEFVRVESLSPFIPEELREEMKTFLEERRMR